MRSAAPRLCSREAEARSLYERARHLAVLGGKSPKVTRGGYTAAERDAWVDEQAGDLKFELPPDVGRAQRLHGPSPRSGGLAAGSGTVTRIQRELLRGATLDRRRVDPGPAVRSDPPVG